MKEIYLVTGAAGFLGNVIVKKLLEQGKEVRALVLSSFSMPFRDSHLTEFYGDVCQKESLIPFFSGLEEYDVFVIHCAGIVSISSHYDEKVYQVNVGGTKNVMDLCLEKQVKKVVHVSSVHAIPELSGEEVMREVSSFDKEKVVGLYAKTKAEASQYVLDQAKKGLNVSIVHPSGIIGPGNYGHDHLSQMVIDYCNHRLTAIVKGGYDFVDVRDVADGILSCLKKGEKGECYLLSNQYYEVEEIMYYLHEITHQKEIKTILPFWFAKLTVPLSELYYKIQKEPPLYTSYSLYTLHSNAHFSHEKATQVLDYHPRDIKETLKDTVDWFVEQKVIAPYKS